MAGSRKPAGAGRRTPRSRSTAGKPGSAGDATTAGSPAGRKGKFNAAGERVNGKWMASAAEAERYRQLLRLDMAGLIVRLETQPVYELVVNNKLICRYRADFRYDVVTPAGSVLRHVIEDIKGFVTPDFELKAKLFDALVETPLSVIKPGQLKGSRALYMAEHWAGCVPDRNGKPEKLDDDDCTGT